MSFPAGASTITLTGTFPAPVAGTARAGRVVLTPSARLVDSTQKAIYSGGGSITLDNAGHFSALLLCTDDTDVQPEGWRWRVDEQPSGGPRATYWIDLPHTLGSTVDLSALAEVDAPDGSGSNSTTATPTGPAGGALDGAYPDPDLSAETIAAFDPAGAASTAQTAAAADATAKVAAHAADSTDIHGIPDTAALETQIGSQSKATTAQSAATTAAAGDATAKVTAHTTASDPHGDRAAAGSALATHEADTTSIHGIANTAALETVTGAQAKANAAQAAAVGYTDTVAATKAALAHAAQHAAAGGDPVTLTQAQITGLATALAALLPLSGGTLTGDLLLHGANLTVQRGDDTGAYRLRVTGGGLDLEVGGMDVIVSLWSGADFTGTQTAMMRWEPAGPHLIGRVQVGTSPYDAVFDLDAAGGKLGLLGSAAVAKQTVNGSWTAGTAGQSLAAALAAYGLITDNTTA